MLETWGIGKVSKTADVRKSATGSETVTIEVNFEERRKDLIRNQPIKVKAWGAVGGNMKGLSLGSVVVVAGRFEVSEYEWQGKPAKSIAILANAVERVNSSNAATERAQKAKTGDFSEFGDIGPELPF